MFEFARRLLIAEIQAVTVYEWLPTVVGGAPLPAYSGYKPTVDPGILLEFATAAFRFGHSLVPPRIPVRRGGVLRSISLRDAFFADPQLLVQLGVGNVASAFALTLAEELDHQVVDELRNFLLEIPHDLVSLNVQRGRDHGLTDFSTMRRAFGLPALTSFDDVNTDPAVKNRLMSAFNNDVNIVRSLDTHAVLCGTDGRRSTLSSDSSRRATVPEATSEKPGGACWWSSSAVSGTETAVGSRTCSFTRRGVRSPTWSPHCATYVRRSSPSMPR